MYVNTTSHSVDYSANGKALLINNHPVTVTLPEKMDAGK